MTEIDCEYTERIIVEEKEEFGHPTVAALYILSGGEYSEARLSTGNVKELIGTLKEIIESEE